MCPESCSFIRASPLTPNPSLLVQTRICGMGMLKTSPSIRNAAAWHRSSDEDGGRPSSSKPAEHRRRHAKAAPAAGPSITIPSFRVIKRQAPEALAGTCSCLAESNRVQTPTDSQKLQRWMQCLLRASGREPPCKPGYLALT